MSDLPIQFAAIMKKTGAWVDASDQQKAVHAQLAKNVILRHLGFDIGDFFTNGLQIRLTYLYLDQALQHAESTGTAKPDEQTYNAMRFQAFQKTNGFIAKVTQAMGELGVEAQLPVPMENYAYCAAPLGSTGEADAQMEVFKSQMLQHFGVRMPNGLFGLGDDKKKLAAVYYEQAVAALKPPVAELDDATEKTMERAAMKKVDAFMQSMEDVWKIFERQKAFTAPDAAKAKGKDTNVRGA